MTQKDRNKLFDYFRNNHDLLLTENEIRKVIDKINDYEAHDWEIYMYRKIYGYRMLNVLIMVILFIVVPNDYISWVILLFVTYNIIHMAINKLKIHKHGK